MINFGLDELGLDDEELIILLLELMQQFGEKLKRFRVLLLLEKQLGKLVLDLHPEEGTRLLRAPFDHVVGQLDQGLVAAFAWESHCHVKKCSDDLGHLALR